MRWQRAGGVIAGVLLLSGSAMADLQVTAIPPETVAVGEVLDICIQAETIGESRLGSYGLSLTWDPAVLNLLAVTGGAAPFDDPLVNLANASLGTIRLADASTVGASGRFCLATATVAAIGDLGEKSGIDLAISSAFGADDLEPEAIKQVEGGSVCLARRITDLRLKNPASTLLDWSAVNGVGGYDVIRGRLEDLVLNGAQVDLGVVDCLENDSLDTTTGPGSEPANPDVNVPLPGAAFFYLVRSVAGDSIGGYGYFEDCVRPRAASSGECPE